MHCFKQLNNVVGLPYVFIFYSILLEKHKNNIEFSKNKYFETNWSNFLPEFVCF